MLDLIPDEVLYLKFQLHEIDAKDRVRKSAFTLIELLVVITTITIFAAILFPVLSQAKGAAQKTSCLSNVKQMTLAAMLYAEDYDNVFAPNHVNYNNNSKIVSSYVTLEIDFFHSRILAEKEGTLTPYTRNTNITGCPNAQDLATNFTNYFLNGFENFQTQIQKVQGLLALDFINGLGESNASAWEAPAETAMLFDAARPDEQTWGPPVVGLIKVGMVYEQSRPSFQFLAGRFGMPPVYVGRNMIHGRHRGFSNVGWMDGHAKSHKLMIVDYDPPSISTYPGYTREYYKRWNFGFLVPPGLVACTGFNVPYPHVLNDPKAENYFLRVKVR